MKKTGPPNDEVRQEYDFRGGVRGKYARQYSESSNIVVLEPDVASEFPTAKAVNDALRNLIRERKPGPNITR